MSGDDKLCEGLDYYYPSDQPTTCPMCGRRTAPGVELSQRMPGYSRELVTCLCGYKFVVEEDPDDDDDDLEQTEGED